MPTLEILTQRAKENLPLTPEDARWLLTETDPEALYEAAHEVTKAAAPKTFSFCTIINSKSGRCSEDCRWCAQSSHWQTGVQIFPIVSAERTRDAAARAAAAGIPRFSLVTSGRKLSRREVRETAALIREAKAGGAKEVCASLGLLTEDELRLLREAGLVRFHCNLETGARFFPFVCTTHTVEDKIAALKAAKRAGLEVCSGGLFGMGETTEDRIDLALTLRALCVPSIPMNFLVPIPGTPLEHSPALPDETVLKTIALFRFANPTAYLRFAGGRMRLSEAVVRKALHIGINSAIAGDLLTTSGSVVENDRKLAAEAGYLLEKAI